MSAYFMDDPREASRLAAKVDAVDWYKRYLERPLTGRTSFLDAGCGPGWLLAEIHRQRPETRLFGVDLSTQRLAIARASLPTAANARLYEGDIQHIPLDDAAVECSFARFILEYVKDRAAAIREMARVTAPGGLVILQDLDCQFTTYYPNDPALDAALAMVLGALSETGFDANAGRQLFTLAHRAGLRDLEVKVEPYHLYYGGISEEQLALWRLKLEIGAAAMSRQSRQPAEKIAAMTEQFLARLQNEETFFYSTLITVTGRKV